MPKQYRNTKGRFRTPTPAEKNIDIRAQADTKILEDMLRNGAPTFILIYADWCGHCHRYLPTWAQLEDTPGRTANMARVHYDMQEHIPAIKDAKIQGYPSVIKVLPDGRLQSFAGEGGATNAVPYMREEEEMRTELQGSNKSAANTNNTNNTNTMSGGHRNSQEGGSVLGAFTSAIQQAGPAAILLLANAALRQRSHRARTYRTPKRVSRRASTRRARR
jgi:thiol-disulfide isomerase/thioredoxin